MSGFWTSQTHMATRTALFLVALASSTIAECYWPNGDTAVNYVSCPDSKVCCLKGEACLSNGICYAGRYNIAYRGACTDLSWPIGYCPRASITDQWANLLTCSGTATGNFTCSTAVDGKTACEQNIETWTWEGDSGVNVTAAQNGVLSTSSTNTSSCSTNNSSSSLGDSSSTTSSANFTTYTSESASNKSASNKSEVGLEVGLAVGLGVPLILAVSVLAFYCLQVRRRSKATGNTRNELWNVTEYRSSPMITTQGVSNRLYELKAESDPTELHG
ncbi:hypothetical protein N7495_001159 [Penicillium taxi]|uniref:uncharacterized protein n=1 Tax=Penicillium taxi TaxID=168475 RepID=UPI00254513A9|nr:uncharacterized protein N7495_001159 [Penicillium taxi]KAJ5908477.1 hypothetical protein N7495_001159 [Penicillium taxi]